MYAIICVTQDIISTLYDISPYYLWHQMHYIHYITCIIYDISSTLYGHIHYVCYITQWLSMTSNPICLWHIHLIWHHTECCDHTTIVCLHSHYAWDYTQCIFDITHNVPTSGKEINVCLHSLYMYDTICTTYDITSTLYGITPLYLWCQVHYIYHHIHSIWPHVHCIYVITPTLSMISQPPYVWYHIQYTCDILSTIFMTSYPLCKTTQHGVLLIPHSAYVWRHLHYRWYHFHSITPNRCLWCHIYYRHDITPTLFDIAPTVSLSSQTLHWYHIDFIFW